MAWFLFVCLFFLIAFSSLLYLTYPVKVIAQLQNLNSAVGITQRIQFIYLPPQHLLHCKLFISLMMALIQIKLERWNIEKSVAFIAFSVN